jgi:hypothetical protein
MSLVSDFMTNWSGKKYKHVLDIDGTKVFVAQGTTLQRWQKAQPDVLAFTFSNTIVVQGRKNLTPEVLRHERKHIEQIRRMGGEIVFRPALLLSSLWALVTRGDPHDNYFEREAYAAERD